MNLRTIAKRTNARMLHPGARPASPRPVWWRIGRFTVEMEVRVGRLAHSRRYILPYSSAQVALREFARMGTQARDRMLGFFDRIVIDEWTKVATAKSESTDPSQNT